MTSLSHLRDEHGQLEPQAAQWDEPVLPGSSLANRAAVMALCPFFLTSLRQRGPLPSGADPDQGLGKDSETPPD